MDWQSLKSKYPTQQGQPSRCANILALQRVLWGKQYDVIPNDFSKEQSSGGEYIPLDNRRPSVRTNLCRSVVDDTVSLLFGDSHYPDYLAEDDETATALTTISNECCLESIMAHVALEGSVGSVALLIEVNENKPIFTVMTTQYLTPTWDRAGCLSSVVERYAVSGRDLAALGYPIGPDNMATQFWWVREWTPEKVIIYTPKPITDLTSPEIDESRTEEHGLGFVPIVWFKNFGSQLQGCADGPCTFEAAIDTVIEQDYLLSQGGRALKYASDPKLVLKSGPSSEGIAANGGAANALLVPPEGDAKLLEINGKSSVALLEHCRELRGIILEQIHGNRAHADKISAAQSGRAMEMMNQPLVWLAERLRQPYGHGLTCVLRMLCQFSSVVEGGIKIHEQQFTDLNPAGIKLRWKAWYPPTDPEILAAAQGLVTAVAAGIMSEETACSLFCSRVGIDDGVAEWARVCAEIKEKREQDEKMARLTGKIPAGKDVLTQADEVRKKAGAGRTETSKHTA